jgi:hypothetical protein
VSSISKSTKIGHDVFVNGTLSLHRKSITRRMSWATIREITRPKDIPYCLLGIFDVRMPLLNGKGESNAFCRLQEEILDINQHDTKEKENQINANSHDISGNKPCPDLPR